MKLSGQRVDSFVTRPPETIRAVLIYGPDAGLVAERAKTLIRSIAGSPDDPFRVVEISPAALDESPGRLWEEAAAIAMTGGRRVIRVRAGSDRVSKNLGAFLDAPPGDACVVIEAEELGPRSSLRALIERADNAAAVPCYLDDRATLNDLVAGGLDAAGLAYDPDAVAYAAERLGDDRQVTRRTIEKLIEFVGAGGRVTLEDVRDVVEDYGVATLEDLALASFSGDHAAADRAMQRCFAEGASAIGALRALSFHIDKLYNLRQATDRGASPEQAMAGMRPPVFFKHRPALERQSKTWTIERLTQALTIVVEAELACKSTHAPDRPIVQRTLMRIAAAARA
ncbi:MAG: DNA polymerase III subunit delta [Alphaproteobacteria bacterium]|nr:DNA polymerase III subunit delta [Alphaproteobacteria bacterium]